MAKENYGLVYVQMPDQLWSLDVCKLLQRPPTPRPKEETPRPRPEFEFLCNYQYHERHPEGPRGRLPFGMKCMMVDSKLHMIGGYWKNMYVNETPAGWANLDVYACEPIEGDADADVDADGTPKAKAKEEEEEEGPSPLPSIRLCKSSTIPSLSGPKIDPIVVTLEDKIYALSQRHHGDVQAYCPALFEVFDPNTRLWTVLPNPPFGRGRLDGLYISHHLACGHKLVVYPLDRDDREPCIFDTRKKKWEYTQYLERDIGNVNGFAQYRDFLIGVLRASASCYKCLQLVAYELDSNGIPNLYRVLTERDDMFYHAYEFEEIFEPIFTVNIGGDGLMCFIYYGIGRSRGVRLSVGLFRIFTDESERDGWRIYARREAAVETYYLKHASDGVEDPNIYSAVVGEEGVHNALTNFFDHIGEESEFVAAWYSMFDEYDTHEND
ncbi:hypothetical protein PS2_015196 [Malus domestica]